MNPCLDGFLEEVVPQVSILGILGVGVGIRSHLGEGVPGCENFEKTRPPENCWSEVRLKGEAGAGQARLGASGPGGRWQGCAQGPHGSLLGGAEPIWTTCPCTP